MKVVRERAMGVFGVRVLNGDLIRLQGGEKSPKLFCDELLVEAGNR